MPQNLLRGDVDQGFLLPPDVRDWLPEGELVWTVKDVVESFDLSAFYGSYRANGQGAAAFEPAVMVAVLMYAHAVGVRSSRAGPPRKFRTSVMGLSYAANCSFRNSLRTSLGVR